MINFGEITSKTIRVPYTKNDIENYVVTGSATYNKENRLTDASGSIRENDVNVANFNIYGEGENTRINLNDCLAGRMSDTVMLAEATLADLSITYPEKQNN